MKLLLTEDGSHTIYSEQFDEIYHSRRGALTESQHVFIQNGLAAVPIHTMDIFEVGFGTGLNALLTWIYAEQHDLKVMYTAVELYPISEGVLSEINFASLFPGHEDKFHKLHNARWDSPDALDARFSLHKIKGSLVDSILPAGQDLVYFDAFSPDKQPELWSAEIFHKVYEAMNPGGILVTYCSKGYVRRNMQEAGLRIEKLPGPPGKREMVRAHRPL
ncbi:MAG: tRNA (5-methylaminomethyl-2-thiouridine)(34)-methyltransferase MnmD [Bacteroidetes bacterium]|nr:tRNA (5-methylaminomethyl-2-thiouridine)(34)-methyltransferase MnmD [Bacteroidota bacterium]